MRPGQANEWQDAWSDAFSDPEILKLIQERSELAHWFSDVLNQAALPNILEQVPPLNSVHLKTIRRSIDRNLRRRIREQKRVHCQPQVDDVSPHSDNDDSLSEFALLTMLSKLDEISQKVIHLRFYEGRTLQAIAHTLNLSGPVAVHRLIVNAILKLRESIGERS